MDDFPKELLNDVDIAKFLFFRGSNNPNSKSISKATMAAIASACLYLAVPNVKENPHLYPYTMKQIGKMSVDQKSNPQPVKKAGVFSPEAMSLVLSWKPKSNLEILQTVLWAFQNFIGVRCDTIHCLNSQDFTVVGQTRDED